MAMDQTLLEKLGLTKTEAKIYVLLLQLGQVPATPIIKKSELHRATVYDVLERLIEKGLVSYVIKSGIRYYSTTEPERFEVILQDREKEIQEQQKTFQTIKSELKTLASISKEQYPVEVLVGKGGLKTALEDVLRKRKTLYALGAQGNFQKYVPEYHKLWHSQRERLRIPCRMIYAEKCRKLRTKEFPLPYVDIRFIDKVYDGPMTTFFYADTFMIIMWAEQPIITRITSKELVRHYLGFFKMIWKMARK